MVLRRGVERVGPYRGRGGERPVSPRQVVRWLRANLLANGVDVAKVTLYDALDAVQVLGATLRAISLEDFEAPSGKPSAGAENLAMLQTLALSGVARVAPDMKQRLFGGARG